MSTVKHGPIRALARAVAACGRPSVYALAMMSGICGVAFATGAASWCSIGIAAAGLVGCLFGAERFTLADHSYLAEHGISAGPWDPAARPTSA